MGSNVAAGKGVAEGKGVAKGNAIAGGANVACGKGVATGKSVACGSGVAMGNSSTTGNGVTVGKVGVAVSRVTGRSTDSANPPSEQATTGATIRATMARANVVAKLRIPKLGPPGGR